MQLDFEAFLNNLTEQLNVSTFIRKFTKRATLQTGLVSNQIVLDMTNYTYNSNDMIEVYVNGLHGYQGVDWTIAVSEGVATITTTATADGTVIDIVVLKSKVGYNVLIGATDNIVVDENNNNILLGGVQ